MWLNDLFNEKKPIIGMVHLLALPGTAEYDRLGLDIAAVEERARQDYENLAAGGIDSVIFCNEKGKPYAQEVGSQVTAVMTRIVVNLTSRCRPIPFGIDVQWDPIAALAIAKATGAAYIRGIVGGTYCGDLGILENRCAAIQDFRHRIQADEVKILTNLMPEFSYSLDQRPLTLRAQTMIKSSGADALGVSGVMAGGQAPLAELQAIKEAAGDFPVFANTGVTQDNIRDILAIADGCCVATCLKEDGDPDRPIDVERVQRLIKKARG